MTLSISVLVPYRPDSTEIAHGWRDRAWRSVVEPFWSRLVDEWPADAEILVRSPPPTGPGHPGDFNHPLAINAAARASSGDLLLVADADCLPDAEYPRLAERALRDGLTQWALPRFYRKLTQDRTEYELAGGNAPVETRDYEWVGDSVSWAGCVAIPRGAFEDVGGYDERIAWWGADDVAMGLTLRALYGDPARLAGVTHYWHPDPLEHNYGHERHAVQQSLVDSYIAAADDPLAIRRVRGLA